MERLYTPKIFFFKDKETNSENFEIEIKSLKFFLLSNIIPLLANSKKSSIKVQWIFFLLFFIGKPITFETLKIKTLLLKIEIIFFSVINLFFE